MATSSVPTHSSGGSQHQHQQSQQMSSSSSQNGGLLNLLDLASAAVACSVTASRSIRQIAKPENGDSPKKNARLKEDGSFVTDADFASQGVIAQAILHVHPELRMMGEESPDEMALHIPKDPVDHALLERAQEEIRLRYHQRNVDRLPLAADDEQTQANDESEATRDSDDSTPTSRKTTTSVEDPIECFVDPSRVCMIVDPLDGTKSYAHGEYDAVSVLIAIILDNKPVFGVIGKPFGYRGLTSILDQPCAAVYGGSLVSGAYVAGGSRIELDPIPPDQLPRAVISASRSKGVVSDFCEHLGENGWIDPEPMEVSGAGEKSVRLILPREREALWFFPKRGTFLWDVAAPDALFRAMGGRMTDKYGEEIDYGKSKEEAENMNGVVACMDPALHEATISMFKQGDWLSRK